MTLRAFTHGYDLFHPQETIVWHDYVRKDAVKHWDDHTEGSQSAVTWAERDMQSKRKIGRLLAGDRVDAFGLGSTRSLEEYEAYAGLSFRLRKAQDYTSRSQEPPNPRLPLNWTEQIYTWMVRIRLQADWFAAESWSDYSFWFIGVHDEQGYEIHRRDLTPRGAGTAFPAAAGDYSAARTAIWEHTGQVDGVASQPLGRVAAEDRRRACGWRVHHPPRRYRVNSETNRDGTMDSRVSHPSRTTRRMGHQACSPCG